jgi:DNA-binding MarR family transcriptional regulator
MREIGAAARLPGQALALFLALHHQTALTGKPIVTLPAKLLTDLGVSRDAKARGLKALEQAGLVYVSRSRGKAARIELQKT